MSAGEVLGSFLAQFYDDKPVPRLILLSHEIEERELLEEALATQAGRKVEIAVPQRGEKRALVEHAVTNAREALGRKHGRIVLAGEAAGRGGAGLRPGGAAAAHRGL